MPQDPLFYLAWLGGKIRYRERQHGSYSSGIYWDQLAASWEWLSEYYAQKPYVDHHNAQYLITFLCEVSRCLF